MRRIRRVCTAKLREAVFELRYRAYRHQDVIAPDASARFEDEFDHAENSIIWALEEDGAIVASMRSTWATQGGKQTIPEMLAYQDVIHAVVPAGAALISGNRLVTLPQSMSRSSRAVESLLRFHLQVAAREGRWALAAARHNHLPYYQRLLALEHVSEPRRYPGLTCDMYLMACDFLSNINEVILRNPQLASGASDFELFEPSCSERWEQGILLPE